MTIFEIQLIVIIIDYDYNWAAALDEKQQTK